jgi:hypothetical protein
MTELTLTELESRGDLRPPNQCRRQCGRAASADSTDAMARARADIHPPAGEGSVVVGP